LLSPTAGDQPAFRGTPPCALYNFSATLKSKEGKESPGAAVGRRGPAAKKMELKAFILDTRRDPATGTRSTALLGSPGDVRGKHCVILDDVADTMGARTCGGAGVLGPGARVC